MPSLAVTVSAVRNRSLEPQESGSHSSLTSPSLIVALTSPESAQAEFISDASSSRSPFSIDWTFKASWVFGRILFSVWGISFPNDSRETESMIRFLSGIITIICAIALIAAITILLVICHRRSPVLDHSDTADELVIDESDELEIAVTA
jgi:hypothetical protein